MTSESLVCCLLTGAGYVHKSLADSAHLGDIFVGIDNSDSEIVQEDRSDCTVVDDVFDLSNDLNWAVPPEIPIRVLLAELQDIDGHLDPDEMDF